VGMTGGATKTRTNCLHQTVPRARCCPGLHSAGAPSLSYHLCRRLCTAFHSTPWLVRRHTNELLRPVLIGAWPAAHTPRGPSALGLTTPAGLQRPCCVTSGIPVPQERGRDVPCGPQRHRCRSAPQYSALNPARGGRGKRVQSSSCDVDSVAPHCLTCAVLSLTRVRHTAGVASVRIHQTRVGRTRTRTRRRGGGSLRVWSGGVGGVGLQGWTCS